METTDSCQQAATQRDTGPSMHIPYTPSLFDQRAPYTGDDPKPGRHAGPPSGQTSSHWPEPEIIAPELPTSESYPSECWGPLLPVLEVNSRMSGVSLPVAAASVIPSVSLLAQADYRTLTLGAEAPLSTFFLGLVSSGGRKTSSFRLSFKPHLDADEFLVARYEAPEEVYKRQSSQETGDGTNQPRIRSAPPNSIQTDVTKTALVKSLARGRPAQCLAMSDAGVVMSNWSSRGRQATETYQTFTSLWDGQFHSLSRASHDLQLRGRTLSIAWLAQPEFAGWLIGPIGALGLSSRFLLSSDDNWVVPRITNEGIDALVIAEEANEGFPPVDPVLQRYWEIIAAFRRIQDNGMEYMPEGMGAVREPPI